MAASFSNYRSRLEIIEERVQGGRRRRGGGARRLADGIPTGISNGRFSR